MRIGMPGWGAELSISLVDILIDLGELTSAEAAMQAMIANIPNMTAGPTHLWARTLEARYYRSIGDFETAHEAFENCRLKSQKGDLNKYVYGINTNFAELLIEMDMLDEAEDVIAGTLLLEDQVFRFDVFISRLLLAFIRARQGKANEARSILDQAAVQIPEPRNWIFPPLLSWAEAEVSAAGQQWEQAVQAYETAASLNGQSSARWWQALMVYRLGMTLFHSGDPDLQERGRDSLRKALQMYMDMPAPGYIERIENQLQMEPLPHRGEQAS
jgi:tetratricopeptide (TPR) repeat protein